MSQKTVAFIRVQYKFIQGRHIFTSDDMDGLLVVSEDAETAYRDVAPSIKKLLKMSKGIECDVEPALPLKEFISQSTHENTNEKDTLVLSDKEFLLIPA